MFNKNIFNIIAIKPQEIWFLREVKNYMRIEADYDDELINSLIDAAIIAAENFTKLSIMSRVVQFICDIQNQQSFQLKYRPINNIEKIVLKQKTRGEITLNKEEYYFDYDQSILFFKESLEYNQLIIDYQSGFSRITIPKSIKHGILMHILEMYDRQEHNDIAMSVEIKNLYLPYRQLRI